MRSCENCGRETKNQFFCDRCTRALQRHQAPRRQQKEEDLSEFSREAAITSDLQQIMHEMTEDV